MSKLAAIALVAITTLSTACTKKSTMVGGGMVALGGAVVLGTAVAADTSCPPDDIVCGVVFEPAAKTFQVGMGAVGAVALVTGIALIVAGASMKDDTVEQRAPVAGAEPQLATSSATSAAAATSTASTISTTSTASTTATIPTPREPVDRSRPESRLATQASVIARTGNCSAAAITAKQLQTLDAAMYERLLAEDAAVARCTAR